MHINVLHIVLQEHIPICNVKTVLQSLLGFSRPHADGSSAGGLLSYYWLVHDALGCGLINQKGGKAVERLTSFTLPFSNPRILFSPCFAFNCVKLVRGLEKKKTLMINGF